MSVEISQEVSSDVVSSLAQVADSGFVEVDGEWFYCISNVSDMPPFLMNVVSGSDHWMFVGSNGGITAGRRNADNALFPYYTQDKLFELAYTTGSRTAFWVSREASGWGATLWEPFVGEVASDAIQRNLYKRIDGGKIVFEEINSRLGLRYRYSWSSGDRFGFVKGSELVNLEESSVHVRLLDGIQNMVPYGLDQDFVTQFSNLADAYKKNELLEEEGLGVYYLSSIPTDRAEPSEGLKATVTWSVGLEAKSVLLSPRQLKAFRAGDPLSNEGETRGLRCAYFVESEIDLEANAGRDWVVVSDINQDASQVEAARVRLLDKVALRSALETDLVANRSQLIRKIGASDGLQLTSDSLRDSRHCSNVLFNVMRGGTFDSGYDVSVEDFRRYLDSWNRSLLSVFGECLGEFRARLNCAELVHWAEETGDLDLIRLTNEYLPLSFSRRHGDPSRPWNKFSIETQDDEGNPVLSYQGNWRDIFQNWEPLGYSYPNYLIGMVSRFLNASTADGYNPYRVTRDGFDWEILDPEEPWSNIGYWGDHQIIYLLRLLEALNKHSPEELGAMLGQARFVYADVPYRIRGFEDIWANPRETIYFADDAAEAIEKRTQELGADGKLLCDPSGSIVRASLLEKLLVPLLAKMSNFVVDGGIWMNTQRPEWNDANNALVGYGVSAVTLCYVHRYLEFLEPLLSGRDAGARFVIDERIASQVRGQVAIFGEYEEVLGRSISAKERYSMLKALGEGGELYRNAVYGNELGGDKVELSVVELLDYVRKALSFVGESIDSNRRTDGMYHSYNLLSEMSEESVEVAYLPEMLEGQVAVLSSNRLSTEDVVGLLKALRGSRLYREDVGSYLLYPNKDLPSFLEKNRVDGERVEASALLRAMLEKGDSRVVQKDVSGVYRFNGDFRNGADVAAALEGAVADYETVGGENEVACVLSIFEDTFKHRSFTGRSGTFFAYEGLGSIYWHMVSKLVLAIQENCQKASRLGVDESLLFELNEAYFETLNGLGFDKEPAKYGAFPIDAYSHTPEQAGAQQPGMTGQVKEDILSRWGEFGVQVEAGCLRFDPYLLKAGSFLENADHFDYIDIDGAEQRVEVEASSLVFTYCQVLVTYRLGEEDRLSVYGVKGRVKMGSELSLSVEDSKAVFSRSGEIRSIEVVLNKDRMI